MPSGKSPTSSVDRCAPPLTPQVDSTKRILDWVVERGAAIIDVNVLPKPPASGVRAARDPDRIMERRLAEHVWDTIVECARRPERRLIGSGCRAPNGSSWWARAWRARPSPASSTREPSLRESSASSCCPARAGRRRSSARTRCTGSVSGTTRCVDGSQAALILSTRWSCARPRTSSSWTWTRRSGASDGVRTVPSPRG